MVAIGVSFGLGTTLLKSPSVGNVTVVGVVGEEGPGSEEVGEEESEGGADDDAPSHRRGVLRLGRRYVGKRGREGFFVSALEPAMV